MGGVGWGHVNVPCTLHTLLMFPQLAGCRAGAGVGWGHVNVPCTLHTLLMFRSLQDVGQGGGVGWGMLAFLVQ